MKKIFRNFREEEMIELFTDTIKYHYLSIKKNQNELYYEDDLGWMVQKSCEYAK